MRQILIVIASSNHLTGPIAGATDLAMLTYQKLLTDEFIKRNTKNASYSLRGFARDLDLSQSFLSQVLNDKRKLSDEKAILISEKLKFKGNLKKLFVNLVRLDQISDPIGKKILRTEIDDILKRFPSFKLLSEDVFDIISDWHYFAILELTAITGFKNDVQWISRKLGISSIDTKVAIQRLKRVGLLSEENGQLIKTEKDYLFENVPSKAIRKHHQDTLDLAKKALEEQEMAKREFFTVSFPMDPKLIPEVKTKIREFSQSLMAEMQESQPKSIYKLAVQFFRLDREV